MLDKYLLKYDGIESAVGNLTIDIEGDLFEFEPIPGYDGPLPFFLKSPNSPLSTSEKLKMWVLDRAPEPEYELIDMLIEKAGLKEYDAYGFFKYNGGKFNTDKFYVEVMA